MVDNVVAREAPVKKLHYNEGQLVKLLDEKKIGRPSTFSSLFKVQDREYVQKQNFRGPEMTLREWTLQSGKIYSRQKKCVSEKQKLVLQKKRKPTFAGSCTMNLIAFLTCIHSGNGSQFG